MHLHSIPDFRLAYVRESRAILRNPYKIKGFRVFSGLRHTLSPAPRPFVKSTAPIRAEALEAAVAPFEVGESDYLHYQLREASRYAHEHKERISHADLFAGLQEIIDAGK